MSQKSCSKNHVQKTYQTLHSGTGFRNVIYKLFDPYIESQFTMYSHDAESSPNVTSI